ncbi:Uncharacterised protein [Actinobaculum suis]|uniref:HTH tetR-type domain-containing protein n=1 Tax=Actinobaculum suis TaxID=1657 RepID=A0A7Z8YA10_9ACTO|nr:TetR/AcrR family transcriptional regulator [Actinobaculum suis]VDG76466.1 Uncharacterised protein [Actinobaculum suis]
MKDSRPKKVGRKQRFNADDVVKAALEIGVHEFTMNDIAGKIGVAAPAVYRIFSGRQEVVEVAIQHALRQLQPVESGLDYKTTLIELSKEYTKLFDEYEGLADELVGDPRLVVWSCNAIEPAIANLMDDGFDQDVASFVVTLVAGQTAQHHALQANAPDSVDEDAQARFERDTPLTAAYVEKLAQQSPEGTPGFLTLIMEWADEHA